MAGMGPYGKTIDKDRIKLYDLHYGQITKIQGGPNKSCSVNSFSTSSYIGLFDNHIYCTDLLSEMTPSLCCITLIMFYY